MTHKDSDPEDETFTDNLTPLQLTQWADDPRGKYFVHRHGGDHEESPDCWCSPMVLTQAQVFSYSLADLQLVLNSFFAVQ